MVFLSLGFPWIFFTQFHYKWNFGFCFKTYITDWMCFWQCSCFCHEAYFSLWGVARANAVSEAPHATLMEGSVGGRRYLPGLAMRSVSAHGQCPSWAVSPCWTVPHAWSLGTSSAAMFLLKMSCVWCAWWVDSKPHSHDLLSRRCRSCSLGRPESVPCKSCQPSSLGKDFECLTSVPTGGLGTQCYRILALSENQSTSELEGPWETS